MTWSDDLPPQTPSKLLEDLKAAMAQYLAEDERPRPPPSQEPTAVSPATYAMLKDWPERESRPCRRASWTLEGQVRGHYRIVDGPRLPDHNRRARRARAAQKRREP